MSSTDLLTPPAIPAPPDDDRGDFTEFVGGRLVELPPMGAESVWVVSRIQHRLGPYAEDRGLGAVVGEMLFTLNKTPLLRRRPDVAFVSAARWPLDRPIPRENGWEVVPDLAVEVVSPTDPFEDVIGRILDFLAAGSALAWLVLPRSRQVYIYEGPAAVRILSVGDELDGGAVLPGFRCPVASLFPPAASRA